jgi:hypothetical protein
MPFRKSKSFNYSIIQIFSLTIVGAKSFAREASTFYCSGLGESADFFTNFVLNTVLQTKRQEKFKHRFVQSVKQEVT